ncbi:AI-2E family transporter [Haladaptatus salinisoli]|uniref:AI-2E family transporter n=1 Tax=Haladaptatus salinisoli TaxID=2884876 RepID=UPI001D0ADDD8|nr:AI-2E family transporter [Haladaptatus salinisoli]
MKHDITQNRERIAWWLIFSILGVLFVYILYSYVGTIILGLFIYYATRPVYRQLTHRVGSPTFVAGLSLGMLAFPGLLLIAYTVLMSIHQVNELFGSNLDQYQLLLGPYLQRVIGTQDPQVVLQQLLSNPQQLTQYLSPKTMSKILTSAGGYLSAIVVGFLHIFIALAIAFYLLRDDQKLANWFTSQISNSDSATHAFLEAVDTDLQTIYFGNILNAFVVAIIASITYMALNAIAPPGLAIPAAVLFGLLTGLASLVPVVGMKLVYVPVGLYLAGTALVSEPLYIWFPVAFLLITATIVDGLTEILLRPYISGRNLHVGLVLFAYIFGPLLFGWYGLFLGPLLLVLFVHSTRIILSELIHGHELTPQATATDPIPNPNDNRYATTNGDGSDQRDLKSPTETSAADQASPAENAKQQDESIDDSQ